MYRNLLNHWLPCCLAIGMIAQGTAPLVGEALPGRVAADGKVMPDIIERFQSPEVKETPDFQKHVIPLMGRLGCNGRACHGSFQGRGGFVLSLFGYDFKADHQAISAGDEPRVDLKDIDNSLIISKPTDEDMHEGGQRYELDSWEHRVLKNWIADGAKYDADNLQKLDRLDITPREILFDDKGQTKPLRVVAVWADGTKEDVTPICRYTTNDDQIAEINGDGIVSSGEPGDTHVVVAYDKAVVAIPVIRPVSNYTGDRYPEVPTPTKIDELVVQKLKKIGLVPSDLASDEQFLRRVSLDIAGTLPTPKEIKLFTESSDPDKQAKKIDELLETPAYAAKWTTLLCDITGNNDQQLNNVSPARTGPAQEWYDWLYERVERNEPYDDIAEGILLARSRMSNESYREYCESMSAIYQGESTFADRDSMTHYWARREFRQPEERAIAVAYTFMGVRIQCAQCHKHPFDVWSKDDFDEFKDFFAKARFAAIPPRFDRAAFKEYQDMLSSLELDEKLRGNLLRRELAKELRDGKTVPFPELVVLPTNSGQQIRNRKGKNQPNAKTDSNATILGEETINLNDYQDARQPIMDWLRREDNRYFARAFVNRVWASYFSVGIVHPTDDLSLGNPPSNEALLDYLAQGFIAHDFDMKWLHREIANSRTYQLSWVPNETNRLDTRNFSRSVPRRLPAEVAYDIMRQAIDGEDKLETYLTNLDRRAIAIPGTRIGGEASYPLQIFGRSERVSNCDCDRSAEATLLQTVFMQNDSALQNAITNAQSWIGQLEKSTKSESKGNTNRSARLELQLKQGYKMMTAARDRAEKFEKAGKKAQAREIRNKIAAGKKRMATLREQLAKVQRYEERTKPEPIKLEDPADMVRQAYLRTLSRQPTQAEMTISLTYLREEENPVDGLHDLMWALLNTKEFIVNH